MQQCTCVGERCACNSVRVWERGVRVRSACGEGVALQEAEKFKWSARMCVCEVCVLTHSEMRPSTPSNLEYGFVGGKTDILLRIFLAQFSNTSRATMRSRPRNQSRHHKPHSETQTQRTTQHAHMHRAHMHAPRNLIGEAGDACRSSELGDHACFTLYASSSFAIYKGCRIKILEAVQKKNGRHFRWIWSFLVSVRNRRESCS